LACAQLPLALLEGVVPGAAVDEPQAASAIRSKERSVAATRWRTLLALVLRLWSEKKCVVMSILHFVRNCLCSFCMCDTSSGHAFLFESLAGSRSNPIGVFLSSVFLFSFSQELVPDG